MRTIRVQNCNSQNNQILDHLSISSKSIWNISIFVNKFFDKYKNDIYKKLFIEVYNNIDKYNSYDDFNKIIFDDFKQNLAVYSDNYDTLKTNQNLIYNEVISFLDKRILNNTNYYTHLRAFNKHINKTQNIIIPEGHENVFFNIITDNIFDKLYSKNFFDLKHQMNNKIPFKINNDELIKNVKQDNYLLKDKYKGDFSCKQWINDILHFKFNKNHDSLNSEINYYAKYLDFFKETDIELINFIYKIDKCKTYNYHDKVMLEIMLSRLKFLTKKIKFQNIINNDEVFKNITSVEIQIELLKYVNNSQLIVNSDTTYLRTLCKFVLKIVKSINTEIIKLNKKLEQSNTNIKNIDFVYPIINKIRYYSIINDWKSVDINIKNIVDFSSENKLIFTDQLSNELKIFDIKKFNGEQLKQKIFDLTNEMIDELKLEKQKSLTSDRSIIDSLTRINIEKAKLNDKLSSDVINNIFTKVNGAISSFYALKKLGNKKANYPNFLGKNDKCNIKYLNDYSMKCTDEQIIIFTGKYINNNYNDFIFPTYSCLQKSSNHSKYVNFSDLKEIKNNKILKSENYIYTIKNNKQFYINKKSTKIVDGGQLIFNIPDNMYETDKKTNERNKLFKKIIQIEIIPNKLNNYDLHITYEPLLSFPKLNKNSIINPIEDGISIDLGMVNLMTIYDPKGNQNIIKGGKLLSINHYFNKIIEDLQSKLKKINNKYTSKKINNLYKKRENIINYYFDMIVKWLFETYGHKKIFVIGYNVNWKDAPKMGKKTRKIFCKIPYRKLLTKIHNKGEEKRIVIREINESYTSKSDALKLEEVCYHEKYSGMRLNKKADKDGLYHRGLYLSGNKKCINSDLNGAINIMRKYCKNNNVKFEEVKGNKIYNPEIIRIKGYSYKLI